MQKINLQSFLGCLERKSETAKKRLTSFRVEIKILMLYIAGYLTQCLLLDVNVFSNSLQRQIHRCRVTWLVYLFIYLFSIIIDFIIIFFLSSSELSIVITIIIAFFRDRGQYRTLMQKNNFGMSSKVKFVRQQYVLVNQ